VTTNGVVPPLKTAVHAKVRPFCWWTPDGQVTFTRLLRCVNPLCSMARSTFSVLRIVGDAVDPQAVMASAGAGGRGWDYDA
jgi:hypothetical protein